MDGCDGALCEAVKHVTKIVQGNGEPGKSLIMRVENIEKKLGVVNRLIWGVAGGVGLLVVNVAASLLSALVRG